MLLCLALAPAVLPAQPASASAKTGVDVGAINKSADPCVDFYQYACGNWNASHPLPTDRARYGRFAELQERNEKTDLKILQTAADGGAGRSPLEQKIGDYYASCMATAAIDKKGVQPIKAELNRIYALATAADVVAEVAALQRQGAGVLFRFSSEPDAKDSSRTIAALEQGGLALPDRDYYLKQDAKSVEIRQRYLQHIKNMFVLAGDAPDDAAAKAQMVLDCETIIAQLSMDRVSLRDPDKTYHLMTRQDLEAMAPRFPWEVYFSAIGAPAFDSLNVGSPDFIRQVMDVLPQQGMAAGQAYFAFHLLHEAAPRLAAPLEQENFDFFERYLAGTQQPRSREMRCVVATDAALGDLLGQKYIETAFGPDAKAQITALVDELEKTMGRDIQDLPWMGAETKKAAQAKLQAITNNIGYPKEWQDYSKVAIVRDDYEGDTERANAAMYEHRLSQIGKPTNRGEWRMTTPTVNAFYQPANNSINFPAGILQPPFFDPNRDMAVNFGGIGVVIGHEMTHGFDDQGRKYDGAGNLRDWWTAADGAEFDKRAACVADEYSGFTSVDDVKLNGRLTLGENTADNGGMRIAYMALEDALGGKGGTVDGFTPEQRLFLGFAQVWCENMAPQEARNRAMTDPHSPGRFRVNGTVQNMPEFQKAFACKATQPMVSKNACRVW
ncbi:MAG TPA: M13 family metallopeptidase [Bryobacteraceae bacterium]|nr:M13 family metallopeptidase [Bryobacteraceae bacterium]